MKNVREKQKKKKSGFDIKTAKRVLRLIRSSRWVLIASLLCAAVSALLSLAVPLLVGDAIDEMLGPNAVNLPRVTGICIAIGVSALVTALTQWGMNVLNNRMAYHLVYRLRREAFEKLQRLPLSYLDSRSTGGLLSRMVNDVDQFTDGLLLGFNQFFTGILTILGTLIIMLTVKPSVALVVIFITPLSLFVASFIASRTYSMFKLQSETRAEQTAMIDEYVGNHKVVTAFGYEDESQEIFDHHEPLHAVCQQSGLCGRGVAWLSALPAVVRRVLHGRTSDRIPFLCEQVHQAVQRDFRCVCGISELACLCGAAV